MQDCNHVNTPVNNALKFLIATEKDECIDQSAIGSLMYLSVSTRPDIAYAVCNLARFSSEPTKEHWTTLKHVLCYLKGTPNYGILYSQKDTVECVGFSDTDWTGDINNRKSTSGYIFQLTGAAVTWRSKR